MSVAGGITLGILAGGRGTRLGGVDKAWLRREGMSQVERLVQRMSPGVDEVLISANSKLEAYAALGFTAVPDLRPGLGPLAGLEALCQACSGEWLLTAPVDLFNVNDCLLRRLKARGGPGAYAVDADGPQPLVALWHVATLRPALAAAIEAGDLAVHRLQARLGMVPLRLDGVRFGNLNTPQDLAEVGMKLPDD
ncbi:MAG: molybdenum cofactor guanylyltransferase [Gammaproteobacteria bacterium]|nr:molybdenum cofactor guanylyltransferase [Gammaproteobacteria bacterium]